MCRVDNSSKNDFVCSGNILSIASNVRAYRQTTCLWKEYVSNNSCLRNEIKRSPLRIYTFASRSPPPTLTMPEYARYSEYRLLIRFDTNVIAEYCAADPTLLTDKPRSIA